MKNLYFLLFLAIPALRGNAQVGIGTVSPNSTLDVRGSFSPIYRSFTTATSLTTNDHTVVFTGTTATTVTLPDATTCSGRIYCMKNFSTTLPVPVLTISTVSSQKIDGAAGWLLDVTNETITIISDGANWEVFSQSVPSSIGSNWAQGGNSVPAMKSLGTINNFSLPIITNNVERMRVDSMGNVAIGGSIASPAANAEKFLLYAGATTSPNLISAIGSINNFLQLNIQNTSGAALASTDLITTNDVNKYVDMGINSSGYVVNSSPILSGIGNAYFYTTGNDFIIGDSTIGKNLIFFTGGAALANERMRIDGSGNVGIGNIVPTTVLDVNGTVKMRSTVQVGAAGTPLNSIIRFTNQSITDNTGIPVNNTRQEVFTLAGVTQYASVVVNPRSILATGLVISSAYASATNTVSVTITNVAGGALALGTVAFDFTIIQ
jgi:hypothetical protein